MAVGTVRNETAKVTIIVHSAMEGQWGNRNGRAGAISSVLDVTSRTDCLKHLEMCYFSESWCVIQSPGGNSGIWANVLFNNVWDLELTIVSTLNKPHHL